MKDSFEEGNEYIEITFNEGTKKIRVTKNMLHNDHHIKSAQPGDPKCPVASFKAYLEELNPNIPNFFQRPNKRKRGFDCMVIGKEPLANHDENYIGMCRIKPRLY